MPLFTGTIDLVRKTLCIGIIFDHNMDNRVIFTVTFSLFITLREDFMLIIFLQASIAYFPLVILISGVISSLGAKKLDKMLGAKVRWVSNNNVKGKDSGAGLVDFSIGPGMQRELSMPNKRPWDT